MHFRRTHWFALIVVIFYGLFASTLVFSQEASAIRGSDDILARLDALEKQAALNGPANFAGASISQAVIVPRWYGFAEAVFLKGANEDGDFNKFDTFTPGMRFTLGRQLDSGLGFRARFFDYYQSVQPNSVSVKNLDLEITDTVRLGKWDVMISGGARYTNYQYFDGANNNFNGVGPTVGLQVTRALRGTLSLYGSIQEALEVGSYQSTGNESDFKSRIPTSYTEIKLGLQCDRDILFVRGGFESQAFTNISDGPYGENGALIGFFIGGGFHY